MIQAAPGAEWGIDLARAGQGEQIARMIRLSIPRHLRLLTIWASNRAGLYVESLLRGAFAKEQHKHYLLRRGTAVAGLAVFRRLEHRALLNHLYVAPRWRGRSFGAWLLGQAAERYLERHPARQVALDVMAGSQAEAWYERLGFSELERRGWWVARHEPRHHAESSSSADFQVEAIRRDRGWGFHQFACVLPGGRRYEVGSLYYPYFRLSDPRAADDGELHEALAALDPKRKVLVIAAGDFTSSNWRCIAVSRRLACDAHWLLDRLAVRAGAVATDREQTAPIGDARPRAGKSGAKEIQCSAGCDAIAEVTAGV